MGYKKPLKSERLTSIWPERWDLNPRPLAPEASALPSCATSRFPNFRNQIGIIDLFRLIHPKHPYEISHLRWWMLI